MKLTRHPLLTLFQFWSPDLTIHSLSGCRYLHFAVVTFQMFRDDNFFMLGFPRCICLAPHVTHFVQVKPLTDFLNTSMLTFHVFGPSRHPHRDCVWPKGPSLSLRFGGVLRGLESHHQPFARLPSTVQWTFRLSEPRHESGAPFYDNPSARSSRLHWLEYGHHNPSLPQRFHRVVTFYVFTGLSEICFVWVSLQYCPGQRVWLLSKYQALKVASHKRKHNSTPCYIGPFVSPLCINSVNECRTW